jgi:hypothetical protein
MTALNQKKKKKKKPEARSGRQRKGKTGVKARNARPGQHDLGGGTSHADIVAFTQIS